MWNVIVNGPRLTAVRKAIPEGNTLSVGRAEDNDIVLHDERVSRRHAQISWSEDGLRIGDLSSRNGTLLNGRSLGRLARNFMEGDVVTIGDYVIRVEHDGVRRPRPSHPPQTPESFVTLMASPVQRGSKPSEIPVQDAGERTLTGPVPQAAGPDFSFWLNGLAQKLIAQGPSMAFLQELLSCAVAVTGFEESALLTTDDGESFQVRLKAPAAKTELVWSTTLLRRALETRSTLFVHHLPGDPRFHTESILLSRSLHVICAPMVVDSVVMGALYLSTRAAEVPCQETVDFVSVLAQLGANALERLGQSGPPPQLAAVLGPVSNGAQFLRATLVELSKVLTTYRQILGRCALKPSDVAELGALEAQVGIEELLEEAPQVAATLVQHTDGLRSGQRLPEPNTCLP